jgi:hypothetical protein
MPARPPYVPFQVQSGTSPQFEFFGTPSGHHRQRKRDSELLYCSITSMHSECRMHSLRLRVGIWPALIALAIQFCVSFGHVHGIGADGPATVHSRTAQNLPSPTPAQGGDHDDDYCAICAVLALVATSQTASAPTIALVVAPVSVVRWHITAIDRFESPRTAFRSRAPPQA